MIEDTSFLLDLIYGDDGALQRLELIEAEGRAEKISAVSALELYEGVARSSRPAEERDRVREVLDSKHVIAADRDLMRRAGVISGQLHDDGSPIEREDCVVAATALREGEPIVTRNTAHFDRIEGLDVLSY